MSETRKANTVRGDLRASMTDGVAWSLMAGLGELYFPGLILALSLGVVPTAMVATLPLAIGAFAQLFAGRGVEWLGSHKWWVVLTAVLQALALVPLAVTAFVGGGPWASIVIFTSCSLYFAAGMSGGSAWSTWIGTLVPRRVRSRYFGRRQRALQLGTLAGFLGAGLLLDQITGGQSIGALADRTMVLTAFAGLMLLAAVMRLISALALASKSEPVAIPEGHGRMRPRAFLALMFGTARTAQQVRAGRLLLFMFSIQCAAKAGEPFVAPYLLEDLQSPWVVFAAIMGTQMLGKAITLGAWSMVARRFGPRRLLLIGGLGVVPLGWLWCVSSNLPYLLAVQVLSGAVWACYDLATFLLVLEDVPERDRTSVMSYYFVGICGCAWIGSLLGAAVLKLFSDAGGTPTHESYLWVFAISSGLRLVVAGTALRLAVRAHSGHVDEGQPARA